MKTYEIHSEIRQAQPAAVMTATVPATGIGAWLAEVYSTLARVMTEQGAYPAGPPFARYRPLAGGRFAVEAGFPVGTVIDADGPVQPARLPGGLVARTVHTGPYDELAPAYEALAAWVRDHGGEVAGDPWEVYLTDPASDPDPAAWRTEVVQPYRRA